MARTILRRGGAVLAGVMALVLVVVLAAALTDRPDDEVVVVDLDAAEVAAFLDAERLWLAHHGLDVVERHVEVADPGVRVRVLEIGEGPSVLVVPPATGEVARLAPLLAELDGYRLVLVNLPGGGASDGVDVRAHSHRRLARDTLDAVYDHFGLGTVPLIGASLGGTWALWYALDRPDRVAAVVQLGVPPALEGAPVPAVISLLGVPGLNRIAVSTLLPSSSIEDAARGFEQAFGHPAGTAADLPRPALEFEYALEQLPTFGLSWRGLAQDLVRFGGLGGWDREAEIGRDELAGLDHPTLFVWPTQDPFGDLDLGRQIAAAMPCATLEVAGTGHLPWLDDPAGVAYLVAQFLEAWAFEESWSAGSRPARCT